MNILSGCLVLSGTLNMQHNAGDCHLVSSAAAGRLLHLHVHQQLEQEPQRYRDMYLCIYIYISTGTTEISTSPPSSTPPPGPRRRARRQTAPHILLQVKLIELSTESRIRSGQTLKYNCHLNIIEESTPVPSFRSQGTTR